MDTAPISNKINVRIADLLEDPVTDTDNGSAASLDGVIYSAIRRNRYVAEAHRALINMLVYRLGEEGGADELQGAIKTITINHSSSGASIPHDYMLTYRYLVGSAEVPFRRAKIDLDQDLDPYLNTAYTINGGLIYVYQRQSGVMTLLNSGSGSFQYIADARVNATDGSEIAVNSTPDIMVDVRWHDFIALYGAGKASFDAVSAIADPDPGMDEKGNRFFAMAMALLPSEQSG